MSTPTFLTGQVPSPVAPIIACLIAAGFLGGCSSDDNSNALPSDDCTTVIPYATPEENPYATVVDEFDVVAPSGARLYGLVRHPDLEAYPEHCFAAVVYIPGGINPGRLYALGQEARLLAEAGMVVVTFNAEGRVDVSPLDSLSEGTEDFNGHRNQDGLAEIIRYVQSLPYVWADNVGVRTQSYGITMAAGCLARYPELGVKYLVDGEGPPHSFVTCQEPWAMDDDPTNDKHEIVHDILLHYSTYRDGSDTNQTFWSTRDAINFIGDFDGRYVRLQAEWDHSQPPNNMPEIATFTLPPLWWQAKHTCDIVNAAVRGGVPWVRVNLPEHQNAVNDTFHLNHLPRFLPGKLDDNLWAVRAVLEMARMP